MVLTIILAFSACGPDEDDDSGSFPQAKGKLTITGLENFNDKYVYVQGLAAGKVLVGLTDISGYPSNIVYKLAKISGGKANVPLYTANSSASSYSNSFIAYSGNDSVSSVSVIILNDSSLSASNASNSITNNLGMKTITSGTFSNGNIETVWEWSPPSQYSVTQLTENQWGYTSAGIGYFYFTFIATASIQYLHYGSRMSHSLLDINGNHVTVNTSYNSDDKNFRRTAYNVIPGQKYYIRCYQGETYNPSVKICFNSSSTPIPLP
jgi:hypothetical protein